MRNILLLSDDNNLIKSFKEYYKDSSFYNVEIFERIDNNDIASYDAIIIDYFMSNNDGYNILSNISMDIYVFVILPDLKMQMMPFLREFNIYYIFYKPVCVSFVEHIMNIVFSNNINNIDLFRREIVKVFIELGLSFKLQGTRYIFYIILQILCRAKEVNGDLYSIVGEEYHKKEESIKKSITYAIKTCFNKGGNDDIKQEMFGNCSDEETGLVTNFDFIYNITVYIMCIIKEKELVK